MPTQDPPTQDPDMDFPTRATLEQFARHHALIAGNVPQTQRKEAVAQFNQAQALQVQASALKRQIDSGAIRKNKRNLKKLEAICTRIVNAMNEGWSLYQTALTLEALTDPDYLESLVGEWPPNPDDFPPEVRAAAAATAARPDRLPDWIKQSIQSPLKENPLLVFQEIHEHLAQR